MICVQETCLKTALDLFRPSYTIISNNRKLDIKKYDCKCTNTNRKIREEPMDWRENGLCEQLWWNKDERKCRDYVSFRHRLVSHSLAGVSSCEVWTENS